MIVTTYQNIEVQISAQMKAVTYPDNLQTSYGMVWVVKCLVPVLVTNDELTLAAWDLYSAVFQHEASPLDERIQVGFRHCIVKYQDGMKGVRLCTIDDGHFLVDRIREVLNLTHEEMIQEKLSL